MAKKTRIKAKLKKGIVTVKALANHAMLSYQEAEKAKKEVNFITSMVAKVNGKIVYEVSTSQFLSKNPYVKFKFKGAEKGDKVEFTWTDLKGNTQTDSKKIK
ncbi:thiosulfate oxidation carrier complex protein SoxZ [Poseidonibacter lekithochrous]|uniref:thiosulfate oxidation carrier complex protein SoxZ n=1 Tax=Poseidonibacter lekithochrous TaxID=1904463 RepID=UPI0008FC2C13|nr:thiosulfate oxidation carrier complex protein SoxZ [Poseidonibacter lekithochrous]QKJ24111.1 sulfur oxidation protein SoxYZ, sulfur compound chelating protein [Poseidonibacter lekithochrous]